jgi:hypothetical protein
MVGLSLMNMLGLSSYVRIVNLARYWKFFVCTIHKSSVSIGFANQIMPIIRIICYNGSLVIWEVVSFTTAKFKPLIYSVSDFVLWFCLTSASCLHNFYIIVYIQKGWRNGCWSSWCTLGPDLTENTASNSFFCCVLVCLGHHVTTTKPLLNNGRVYRAVP